MLLLSDADIDKALTWPRLVDHLEACHRAPAAEVGDLFLGGGTRTLLNRAAWLPGGAFGLKTVSVFQDNGEKDLPTVQGVVVVFDPDTGAPRAVLDGPAVTRWKTAGDSVTGARRLARPDSRTLLVIGAGVIASTLVEAYLAVFPKLERVLVWNRTPGKAGPLLDKARAAGKEAAEVTDLRDGLGQADIVTSATMARDPFIPGEAVRPGTHVDLIGAFKADMREADDALLRKATIFVDNRDTTMEDIGELRIPLAAGTIAEADVRGDLYELSAGTVGRTSAEEITLFKNGGGAHLDMMVADLAIRESERR